jgi:hypothetical protein
MQGCMMGVQMNRINKLLIAGLCMALASPALAGTPNAPAPIAGLGVGAIVLVGLGYRSLKNRIGR